jgi:hypothetical protein
MTVSYLSPTNLRVWDGGDDFADHIAYNINRMNDYLLRLNGLPDVSACSTTGDVLTYNTSASQWQPHTPTAEQLTTTTTTTTV